MNDLLGDKRFAIFCEELLKWGKIHNLTGYKSESQIYENIKDSIYPLEFIDNFKCALDVGSGSGFPAIPLAILKPKSSFILLEPNAKKVSFLHLVSLLCALDNVSIKKQSIEDFCLHQPKKSIDLITSRALCDSKKLIDLSIDLLNDDGKFLFYKGAKSVNIDSSDCIIRNQRIYLYKSKKGCLDCQNY